MCFDVWIWTHKEDHENAARLATGLKSFGLEVLPAHTNIVFFDVQDAPAIVADLAKHGIRILCTDGKKRCRAVANLHTRSSDIDFFLSQLSEILQERQKWAKAWWRPGKSSQMSAASHPIVDSSRRKDVYITQKLHVWNDLVEVNWSPNKLWELE